jgi:hypothetical protein
MTEFPVCPDTPKPKDKRQVKRQQFAITSGKYQEMVNKHLSMAAEEN